VIRVVTLAAAAIVSARLVAAQAAPHDRGDSVAVELTVVLAGGDPVSSAWTRWVTPRPHGGGAGVASTRVWRARATVDTRLPATAMSDGRAGPVPVYAPDLSVAEASAAARALSEEPRPIGPVGEVTGTNDSLLSRGLGPLPSVPVALDPPRSMLMRPALLVRAAVPVHQRDWVHTETIAFQLHGAASLGDTIWVVVADRGARRWIVPAVLEAATAPAPVAALSTAPLGDAAPIVFGVRQRPGLVAGLLPGFSRVATPMFLFRSDSGRPSTETAALIAEVREHGVSALELAMPRGGSVTVRIIDLAGRGITTIGPQNLDVGYYTVRWDGLRADGRPAGPGVYLAITEALGVRVVTKLVLPR